MASVHKTDGGKKPGRAVQFEDAQGKRRTIRLGRIGFDDARTFANRVEALVSKQRLNIAVDTDADLVRWLAGLSDDLYARLARFGLVTPKTPLEPVAGAPTLAAWCERYEQSRTDLKPASRVKIKYTHVLLKKHLKDATLIDAITLGDAKEWRRWLLARDLSEASVRLHIRNAKTLFNAAVEHELIDANPFRKLKGRAIANTADRVITVAETEAVIAAAPNAQWRLLIGLCRYAGCRMPSETDGLTWHDVDWDRRRLRIRSPKTERFEGKAERVTPITPRLLELLQTAFDEAPEGATLVVTLPGNNRHRNLQEIIRRAGLEPWPDLFHALRRSCATDWAKTLPGHAVARFLGHSEAVSRAHYLKIDDDVFDAVTGPQRAAHGRCTKGEKGAAKGAGADTRVDVKEGAETDISDAKSSMKSGHSRAHNRLGSNGPARIRTENPEIMSPLL